LQLVRCTCLRLVVSRGSERGAFCPLITQRARLAGVTKRRRITAFPSCIPLAHYAARALGRCYEETVHYCVPLVHCWLCDACKVAMRVPAPRASAVPRLASDVVAHVDCLCGALRTSAAYTEPRDADCTGEDDA